MFWGTILSEALGRSAFQPFLRGKISQTLLVVKQWLIVNLQSKPLMERHFNPDLTVAAAKNAHRKKHYVICFSAASAG